MGSGNQTLYCEFVDAFCRVSPRARAVAISEAQDEWRKVRSNSADVRRRIGELITRWRRRRSARLDGRLPSLPVPSHLRHPTDRRLTDSDRPHRPHRRPRHLARMPPCRPVRLSSALSSRKLVLLRPHHVHRTFISWSANNFFTGAYMHLMYVFVWRGGGGGGGSTQTNIVRLKQNVDNWRRPLTFNEKIKDLGKVISLIFPCPRL